MNLQSPFNYMKKYSFIIFFCLFLFNFCSAQIIITGKLINEAQQPLQGVTVFYKNNAIAITDAVGNYNFSVPSLPVWLSFSYVGYNATDILVSSLPVPVTMLLPGNTFLDEAIVKAFEKNGLLKNIPAAVSVLNKNSLERFSNQSFVAAVNTVPGVKMDERSPGSYRLSIRGNLLRSAFGIRNVKVYWNGIPFTDANSNTYINEIAFNNIDKIEIIKGPSGSMYGSGTGGVVLLSNEFFASAKKYIQLQTAAGSYGLFSAGASYVQSGSKTNSVLSFNHQQSDGYRVHTTMRKDAVNYAAKYTISNKQSLSTTVFYSNLYYQTPGALTLAEMQQNPKQARPASGIFKSAEQQKAALYFKTFYSGTADEFQFTSRFKNTTGVYFSTTDFKNPSIRNYESKTETGAGIRSVFQYKNNFFTGTFGGEYQYEFTNTSTFSNKSGNIDTLQYHDKINARQYNLFVQTEFILPADFMVTAGISYNNFYYGFMRVNQLPATKATSNFKPPFIPRLAVLKKISADVNVYAAVSKGFSQPSIDEIHASDGNFNTALNAEEAINYEAGLKATVIKNKLWIDAASYFLNLQNTIVSRRDASGADYYVNAGKTKQYGQEAALNYLPVNNNRFFLRQLKFWINYTNIHARFAQYQQATVKYDGNKLTGTPPNVLVAGTDILVSKGLYADFTYSYTGKIPVNDANTFFAGQYNLLFLKAGIKKRLGKFISSDFFASYEYSFNTPYSLGNDLNAAGNRFFNPSAPSSISVGAKFQYSLK